MTIPAGLGWWWIAVINWVVNIHGDKGVWRDN